MKEQHIRVFDKLTKQMITDEQEFIPLKITNKGLLKLSPIHKENLWVLIPFGDRFVPMAGSGILDQHGREIYEGMWVHQGGTLTGDDTNFTGEVKQYEGTWWIDNGKYAEPLWSETRINTIIRDYQYVAETAD